MAWTTRDEEELIIRLKISESLYHIQQCNSLPELARVRTVVKKSCGMYKQAKWMRKLLNTAVINREQEIKYLLSIPKKPILTKRELSHERSNCWRNGR